MALIQRNECLNIDHSLRLSAQLGRCALFRILFDAGGSLTTFSENHSGLIHLAVLSGNRDMIQTVFGYGCDVNATDDTVRFILMEFAFEL